jgi:hypothetical protein
MQLEWNDREKKKFEIQNMRGGVGGDLTQKQNF